MVLSPPLTVFLIIEKAFSLGLADVLVEAFERASWCLILKNSKMPGLSIFFHSFIISTISLISRAARPPPLTLLSTRRMHSALPGE